MNKKILLVSALLFGGTISAAPVVPPVPLSTTYDITSQGVPASGRVLIEPKTSSPDQFATYVNFGDLVDVVSTNMVGGAITVTGTVSTVSGAGVQEITGNVAVRLAEDTAALVVTATLTVLQSSIDTNSVAWVTTGNATITQLPNGVWNVTGPIQVLQEPQTSFGVAQVPGEVWSVTGPVQVLQAENETWTIIQKSGDVWNVTGPIQVLQGTTDFWSVTAQATILLDPSLSSGMPTRKQVYAFEDGWNVTSNLVGGNRVVSGNISTSGGNIVMIKCANDAPTDQWLFITSDVDMLNPIPEISPVIIPADDEVILGLDDFGGSPIYSASGFTWGLSTTANSYVGGDANDCRASFRYK